MCPARNETSPARKSHSEKKKRKNAPPARHRSSPARIQRKYPGSACGPVKAVATNSAERKGFVRSRPRVDSFFTKNRSPPSRGRAAVRIRISVIRVSDRGKDRSVSFEPAAAGVKVVETAPGMFRNV